MEAGSLFHFGSNIPTVWEAPFSESALLLVVKSKKEGEAYEPYMKGLKDMVSMLDKERKSGTQFYFNQLDDNHEAINFARSVNPDFDELLKNISY